MGRRSVEINNDIIHTIEIGSKIIQLKLKDFSDPEIDIEDLLQVHIYNVIADVVTYPVIFNRISVLKAEADSLEQTVKLGLDIFIAELTERKRKNLSRMVADGKGKEKLTKPTIDEVDNAVKLSPEYRTRREEHIAIQKQAKIIDALYWSAKAKQKMLEVVSAKVKPEDFENEIIEGTVNDVLIKVWDNPFYREGSNAQKAIERRKSNQ